MQITVVPVLWILLLCSCSWLGTDVNGVVAGETLLDRKQAMSQLRMGVLLNTQVCPSNYAAGLYAMNYTVATLLDEPLYTQSSVEFCSFLLTAVPCDLDLDSTSNRSLFIGLYASVIRSCGLKAIVPGGS